MWCCDVSVYVIIVMVLNFVLKRVLYVSISICFALYVSFSYDLLIIFKLKSTLLVPFGPT